MCALFSLACIVASAQMFLSPSRYLKPTLFPTLLGLKKTEDVARRYSDPASIRDMATIYRRLCWTPASKRTHTYSISGVCMVYLARPFLVNTRGAEGEERSSQHDNCLPLCTWSLTNEMLLARIWANSIHNFRSTYIMSKAFLDKDGCHSGQRDLI